jgi:hypothetical protein
MRIYKVQKQMVACGNVLIIGAFLLITKIILGKLVPFYVIEPQADWIYSSINIKSALCGRVRLIHSSRYLSNQHGRHISIKMRLGGLQRCSGRYDE